MTYFEIHLALKKKCLSCYKIELSEETKRPYNVYYSLPVPLFFKFLFLRILTKNFSADSLISQKTSLKFLLSNLKYQ